MWTYNNTDELYHYGIPGMKWGHRKNTSYNIEKQWYNDVKNAKKSRKDRDKKYAITSKQKYKSDIKKANSNYSAKMKKYKNSEEYKNREAKKKKIVKTGAKIAAGALAAYGVYKLNKRYGGPKGYINKHNDEIRVRESIEKIKNKATQLNNKRKSNKSIKLWNKYVDSMGDGLVSIGVSGEGRRYATKRKSKLRDSKIVKNLNRAVNYQNKISDNPWSMTLNGRRYRR